MKKQYVRPTAVAERFTANEYVAACTSEENSYYLFECNAGDGEVGGYLRADRNGDGKCGNDEGLGGFFCCHVTHKAPTTDEFMLGYQTNANNKNNAGSCLVWIDKNGVADGKPGNYHATKNVTKVTELTKVNS